MKSGFISFAPLFLAGAFLHSAVGQPAPAAPQTRIGQIIIVGNDVTQDRVIRDVLGLCPGQVLRKCDVLTAQQNLERRGIFKIDREKGIQPSVTIVEGESEFKDVLVQVQETTTGKLSLQAGVNSKGHVEISLVVEERNFDAYRLPTSLADIVEGRAFRGAGRKLRLEVFRLSAPGSLAVMRLHLQGGRMSPAKNPTVFTTARP